MPESMRLGSQALAVILGGPGVFYLWHSFYVPTSSLKAVLFLGAATVINLMLYPEVLGTDGGLSTINRVVAKITRRQTRR
jgi:hypothetical protein